MKNSIKKIISLVSLASVFTTCFVAQNASAESVIQESSSDVQISKEASAGEAVKGGNYSTNPGGNVGVKKTISSFSDWTEDMLIAKGEANDDPRVYRPNSMYEVPWDLYGLYAAWDDNNIYLMWQYVNVQDVVAPSDTYPISQGKPYICDVPQVLAFNIDPSKGASGGTLAQKDNFVWGCPIDFSTKVDKTLYFSTKTCGQPAVFSAGADGKFDDSAKGPLSFKDAGIKYSYNDGFLGDKMYGVDQGYGENNNRVPGDGQTSELVDFIEKGHDTSLDTQYMITIPYSALGTSKDYVEQNGIGVMFLSTFGLSSMDCLPYDTSMYDNAAEPDSRSQENNSLEKSDNDNITVPLASIGKLRDPSVVKGEEYPNGASVVTKKDAKINDFSASKDSVKPGDEVEFTCDADNADSYEFTIDDEEVSKEEVEGNKLVHTFNKVGTYKVQVTAKGKAGAKDDTKTIEVIVKDDENQGNEGNQGNQGNQGNVDKDILNEFSVSPKAGVKVNEDIVLTANVDSKDDYEYKFVAIDKDGKEEVISDYSKEKEVTWTTSSAGEYNFSVYAKKKDQEDKDALTKEILGFEVSNKEENIVDSKELSIDEFISSIEEGDINTKQSVDFTAKASEDEGVTYTFEVVKDGGEAEELELNKNGYSATWTPDFEGSYKITVIAQKDGFKEASMSKEFTVSKEENQKPIEKKDFSVELLPNNVDEKALGSSVDFYASNKNASGDVTYKFIVNKANSKYSQKEYKDSSVFTFKPEEEGTYKIYVIASDGESSVQGGPVTVTFKKATPAPSKALLSIYLSVKNSLVNTPVEISKELVGTTGDIEYSLKLNGKDIEYPVKEVNGKLTWTPDKAGNYDITLVAKDKDGKEVLSNTVNINIEDVSKDQDVKDDQTIKGDDDQEQKPTADNAPLKVLGIMSVLGATIAVFSKKRQK